MTPAELEALANAATPAWETNTNSDGYTWFIYAQREPGGHTQSIGEFHDDCGADARFAVAAREAVPQLVEEIRFLQDRVHALEADCHVWREHSVELEKVLLRNEVQRLQVANVELEREADKDAELHLRPQEQLAKAYRAGQERMRERCADLLEAHDVGNSEFDWHAKNVAHDMRDLPLEDEPK
jgi:hypothetical protein